MFGHHQGLVDGLGGGIDIQRRDGQRSWFQLLEGAGCIVLRDFVQDLPGLYSAANVYAFPVTDWTGAIDMPLTVLEAMACNRPVISTRFKALPRFLPPGDGLYYFDSVDEAKVILDHITGCTDVATRQTVAPLTWVNIIDRLDGVYTACLRS